MEWVCDSARGCLQTIATCGAPGALVYLSPEAEASFGLFATDEADDEALAGGEEPRYVTRRLIRFASEDVGMADPAALPQAVAADQACHAIGMPECGVVIGQCAVYLALAPKSCAVYRAFEAAMKAATDEPRCPVPLQAFFHAP